MALIFVVCAIIFRLSLDWIEILDRKAEIKRQKEREEKLNIERHVVTIETRVEEFEMYMYEYGA